MAYATFKSYICSKYDSFMTDAYHYLYILSTDTKTWKSEFSFIFVYFGTSYTASECWCLIDRQYGTVTGLVCHVRHTKLAHCYYY